MRSILVLMFLAVASLFGWGVDDYKYIGSSGQKYKYDLSDPIDRISYKTDLSTQFDDKMNQRMDLDIRRNVNFDRSNGQFGAGFKSSLGW